MSRSHDPCQHASTCCAFSWITSVRPQLPTKQFLTLQKPPCWLRIWGTTGLRSRLHGSMPISTHPTVRLLYEHGISQLSLPMTESQRIAAEKVKRFIPPCGVLGFNWWPPSSIVFKPVKRPGQPETRGKDKRGWGFQHLL